MVYRFENGFQKKIFLFDLNHKDESKTISFETGHGTNSDILQFTKHFTDSNLRTRHKKLVARTLNTESVVLDSF